MITIKATSDLNRLDPGDPALPVVQELLHCLIDVYSSPGHPYRPEHHGYIVLVEEGDVDRAIDLPELSCHLEDVPWEGASMHGGYFHAVYLANNEFGISFVIPDVPWMQGKLRVVLEGLV